MRITYTETVAKRSLPFLRITYRDNIIPHAVYHLQDSQLFSAKKRKETVIFRRCLHYIYVTKNFDFFGSKLLTFTANSVILCPKKSDFTPEKELKPLYF